MQTTSARTSANSTGLSASTDRRVTANATAAAHGTSTGTGTGTHIESTIRSATEAPAGPATGPRTSSVVLNRLLDAELGYSPRATGHFINHLAMSLVAAHRLGATDQELEGWYQSQADDGYLVPRERPEWLEPDAARIAERGIDATVAEHLPALVGSPSAQFFHAIIRLELAVDAGHPGQVANALRNWSEANTPIAPPPSGTGTATFAEVLSLLAADGQRFSGARMELARVASSPEFARSLDQLAAHPGLLDEVAAVVIERHTDPRDFGTLHLVTGTRAARALVGLLGAASADELSLRMAQAVAAALAGSGKLTVAATARRASSAGSVTNPTADVIGRRAVESGDAHVAKLVYACLLEERTTGDPIYQEVAARQAGLTPNYR